MWPAAVASTVVTAALLVVLFHRALGRDHEAEPERPPVHPHELLLGLNIGPNLAVTGSLSAFLWLRVARSLGARPSIRRYSALGAVLVPFTLAASLAALHL